jgi:hypothetical protein
VLFVVKKGFVDSPAFVCLAIFCQTKESLLNQELIHDFKELAGNGHLEQRLNSHSTFNVNWWTSGGPVWWETYKANGWRLQINIISGWWRILDRNNMRVARGTTEEQLRNLLEDRPTSAFSNYFDQGYRFSKVPADDTTGKTVILIHGWGVRAYSLQKLAEALAGQGFNAFNYDYHSAERSIASHGAIFLRHYRKLVQQLPQDEKIYILTHSMGGLILRGALGSMTSDECHRISSIVMLGPPNKGSLLAYLGEIPVVREWNVSLRDMIPEATSYVMNIPEPAWLPPTGIIAGKNDGKVAVEDTHLPEPLPFEHIVVNCSHPELRNPVNVLEHILKFFRAGTF